MTPGQEARVDIDRLLEQAGWVVQDAGAVNLYASSGVAVRESPLKSGHGTADYLLYVNQKAAGGVEAKPESSTLTGVEVRSEKYSTGLPDNPPAHQHPPGTGRRAVPPLLPWLDGRNSGALPRRRDARPPCNQQ